MTDVIVIEGEIKLAATVSVLMQPVTCIRGDCDAEAPLLVACGIRGESGEEQHGEFPVCREHMHGFLDHILDVGMAS